MAIEEEGKSQEQLAEDRAHDKTVTDFTKGLAKELGIGDAELKKAMTGTEPSAEAEEEEVQEPEVEDVSDEASEEDVEDTQTTEEVDEDLIPKSKVDKRFAEMTAQNKRLEAEINRLKAEKETPAQTDRRKELESWDEAKLRKAKAEARFKSFESHSAGNMEQANEYMDIENEIDDVLRSAPQRLQQKQLSLAQQRIQELNSIMPDLAPDDGKSIMAYADKIFQKSSTLKNSPHGYVEALDLAVDHYNALSKASTSTDKKGKQELEKQVNRLKKKTSLDTNQIKGNVNKDRLKNLTKKAKEGSITDQTNLVKEMFVKTGAIADQLRNKQ